MKRHATMRRSMGAQRVILIGLALIGVSLFSLQGGAAIATALFPRVGVEGAVFLRLLIGAAALGLVLRPSFRLLARRSALEALLFGVVLAGLSLTLFAAIDRIPLGAAVALQFLGPLGIAVFASRSFGMLPVVALAGAGVALLAGDLTGGVELVGVFAALASAGFWAGYILLAARLGAGIATGASLTLALLVGAIVTAPLALRTQPDFFATETVLLGIALALTSSVIPYASEIEALRRLPKSTFGVLMSLEPAVAALVGFVFLRQALSSANVVGITFVSVAGALAVRTAAQAPDTDRTAAMSCRPESE